MESVLSDVLAIAVQFAASFVAFLVVRGILRAAFQPLVTGPCVHMANRADMPGTNPIEHAFFGHAINTLSSRHNAGDLHVALCRRAEAAVGKRNAAVGFWFGPSLLQILVVHPDDIRHVLVRQPDLYIKSKQMDYLKPLLGPNGLVNVRNPARHRRLAQQVNRAFAPANVKGMAAVSMRRHFAEFVHRTRQQLSTDDTGLIAIQAATSNVTLAVITEAAFRTTEAESREAFARVKSGIRFDVSLLMAVFPASVFNRFPRAVVQRDRATRAAVLDESRKAAEASRLRRRQNDDHQQQQQQLIIDLIAANDAVTDAELLDHSMTFVFAGHETTATALTWLCYSLSQHTEVQEALAAELAGSFAVGVTPSIDDLQDLPLLNAVVLETLRLYSPVISVIREPIRDDVVPGTGTFIPAGTVVMVPFYALHRDLQVYGADADTFRPARWIEDPGLLERVTQSSNFVPFGAGSRACIGKQFAQLELLLGAAMIARTFRLTWPTGGQQRPFRQHGATARPKQDFFLHFAARA